MSDSDIILSKVDMSTQSGDMSSSTQVRSSLGSEKRLIWVDCEMTGLDIMKDVIMEIAVVVTEGDTLEEVKYIYFIYIYIYSYLNLGLTRLKSRSKQDMNLGLNKT